jgi:AcrR family transcriptional regulator
VVVSEDRRRLRGESTRARLLEAATALFAQHGYEGASIESVLAATETSRGALYHHFAGKDALFEAVLERLHARIAREVAAAARESPDPVEALRAGCFAWLRLARDPVVQRIVLIDAPAVVGWEHWRELDERYSFGMLKASLIAITADRDIGDELLDVLAHMLLAALSEAALLIARADDQEAATRAAEAAIDRLLESVTR